MAKYVKTAWNITGLGTYRELVFLSSEGMLVLSIGGQ